MKSAMLSGKIFWHDDSGQDLVEYSLLMAFVCLVSAALFIGVGKTVSGIWQFSNKSMQNAYCAANAS
jgi:Flp pilus assembly pilin Flp